MTPGRLGLSPAEQALLGAIFETHPEHLADFRAWLDPVVADLTRSTQGRIVSEGEADDLLTRLHAEAVKRMLALSEVWEDEATREKVVELLTRHVLAEVRPAFVRRVVGTARN